MKSYAHCSMLSLLVLAACSADSATTHTRTKAMLSDASLAAGVCDAPQAPCFCPDGKEDGIQVCSAGKLQECACPTHMAVYSDMPSGSTNPGNTGVDDEDAGMSNQLCPALQGKQSCAARSYKSVDIPANILFLLDRSGSMACNPPPVQSVADCENMPLAKDASGPTRWSITVDALNATFDQLKDSKAGIGLQTFSDDGSCGVESMPNVGVNPMTQPQLDSLRAALKAFEPRGGTPIVGATVLAYAYLHQEAKAPGNRYVVLMTDGEESCGFKGDEKDAADLKAARRHLLDVEVEKARDANIRTFVIGAPGSEGARGFLSELAFRGGTARTPDCAHPDADGTTGDCHYDLTTGSDFSAVLSKALNQISGRALGCEFETPAGGSSLINVQYSVGKGEPKCLPLDTRPCTGGADGWQFGKHPDGSDDLGRVVLCGPSCDMVKADKVKVDVILGCAPLQ